MEGLRRLDIVRAIASVMRRQRATTDGAVGHAKSAARGSPAEPRAAFLVWGHLDVEPASRSEAGQAREAERGWPHRATAM
ncbi:hypothetical protein GCM10020219_077880 [Nonomuraea dietziae]